MKEFVKMTLAVMCGLFLMGIVGFFLLISAVGSLIAAAGSSSSTVVLPREGVLAMDMSKYSFVEVANPNTDFQALLQGEEIITPVSIWSAVQAVRKAAQDPGVKFLYLKPDGMSIGLAQLQELRNAHHGHIMAVFGGRQGVFGFVLRHQRHGPRPEHPAHFCQGSFG